MITLSRLNGRTVAVNPDLIVWIDVTPDTTLCLAGGERIVVRESLDEVVQRIIAFRKLIGPGHSRGGADLSQSSSRRPITSDRAPSRASIRAAPTADVVRPSIRTTQPFIKRK